jgi:KDO2-lipid IV(A) lauroyltransferase
MAKSKNPFHIRYLGTWFGLLILRIISFLPYSVAIHIGQFIGFIAQRFLKRRRHIAKTNIDLCLSELSEIERKELLDNTMMANGIGALESLYSWWANDKQVLPRVEIKGLEHLAAAKASGQGVILLGAHFTTLDFCGRALSQTTAMDTMYQTQSNAAIDYCLKKARLRNYKAVLEKFELRQFIKNLKQKHVIWYACDQDFGLKNSVFAPFFGVPAATLATLGRLISITHAKPLLCRHFRYSDEGLGRSRYLIEIYDPFAEEPLSDNNQRNAELINIALEEAIRIKPEQYFWVHRRFKRRPDPTQKKLY